MSHRALLFVCGCLDEGHKTLLKKLQKKVEDFWWDKPQISRWKKIPWTVFVELSSSVRYWCQPSLTLTSMGKATAFLRFLALLWHQARFTTDYGDAEISSFILGDKTFPNCITFIGFDKFLPPPKKKSKMAFVDELWWTASFALVVCPLKFLLCTKLASVALSLYRFSKCADIPPWGNSSISDTFWGVVTRQPMF